MKTKGTNEANVEGLLDKWKTQLQTYNAKLQGMKSKAERLETESRQDFLNKVKALEEKISTAHARLEEIHNRYENLKEAREEAWDDLKSGGQTAWEDFNTGVEQAWQEMKIAFETASTRFSEKPDPK